MQTTLGLPGGIPGIVMTIHTFGEYLDFHPHLHMLLADGLFVRSGLFYLLPEVSLKPLEELFRARVITFLLDKGLLPPERARMLRGWVHSGFNVHRSRRVLPEQREDIERLAQYIIRNPFSLDKMQVNEPDRRGLDGSVIYRSAMNVKIQRNFEVFTPSDFIAAITQHIPEKSFQLVRYYGWYSNKMRGQRDKRAAEEIQATGNAVAVIDVSEHAPRRIPSAKWRELIKKVWFLLDPSSPVTYPSHHDIASSDRSERASARTTRKAISYQSQNKRSESVNCGRGPRNFSVASCCRSAKFSSANSRSLRMLDRSDPRITLSHLHIKPARLVHRKKITKSSVTNKKEGHSVCNKIFLFSPSDRIIFNVNVKATN